MLSSTGVQNDLLLAERHRLENLVLRNHLHGLRRVSLPITQASRYVTNHVSRALYAFSLFLPTIVSALGYSGTTANLLSVPPYACAAIFTVIIGFIADRTQQRGLCNVFVSILGMVGFSMLLGSQNPHIKYAGTFLGALGICTLIHNHRRNEAFC